MTPDIKLKVTPLPKPKRPKPQNGYEQLKAGDVHDDKKHGQLRVIRREHNEAGTCLVSIKEGP